jgi:hypothetical protein
MKQTYILRYENRYLCPGHRFVSRTHSCVSDTKNLCLGHGTFVSRTRNICVSDTKHLCLRHRTFVSRTQNICVSDTNLSTWCYTSVEKLSTVNKCIYVHDKTCMYIYMLFSESHSVNMKRKWILSNLIILKIMS